VTRKRIVDRWPTKAVAAVSASVTPASVFGCGVQSRTRSDIGFAGLARAALGRVSPRQAAEGRNQLACVQTGSVLGRRAPAGEAINNLAADMLASIDINRV